MMFTFRQCFALPFLGLTLAVAQNPSAPERRISATVDAAKMGAPASPYLYGQFIEHIADTVNRSVWAEMIDDRKFYYTIDSRTPAPPASRGRQPNRWRPIGSDESVTMDREHAYTGEHSPLIKLDGAAPRGVAQAGIMLHKGRAYSGRIVLAGDTGANVSVGLVWGSGPNDRETVPIKGLQASYAKFPLKFTTGAETDNARIEIAGTGSGTFHIGAVSLMPADNIHGFRTDTIGLLKAQRSGMYRWPGGNFLSAHEWRDAIGDIDKRPPRWDPVWNALQPNDVGTDEFLFMADLLGVDSFLSVNAGFGDAHSAADLVEYVTGSVNTPMGKLRAANGRPAPYKVKWWGIGNEMWGDFQFGHMVLKQYVFKHNLFGEAMRKVDPNIMLVGDGNTPRMSDVLTDNDWSGGMLTNCLPYIDVMSEHYYVYEGGQQSNAQPKAPPVEESVIDAVHRTANTVRSKVEVYEEYYRRVPALQNKKVPIALDEWAYSRLPANIKQTLGNALAFHEMFRHTDMIQMAGHTMATSQLDFNMNDATLNATGLLFKLYRDHMGTIPVDVSGNSPTLAPARPAGSGGPPARPNAGSPTWPLDVSAALSADGKLLTVAIVNPTDSAQDLDLTIQGARLSGKGRMWRLTGPSLTAMTGLARKEVQVTETQLNEASKTLHVAPLAVDMYEFEKAP